MVDGEMRPGASTSEPNQPPVEAPLLCAAALMRNQWAMETNAAAIAETIEGASGKDAAPNLAPRNCDLCKGSSYLGSDGQVQASKCAISGSCELSWTDMHPDFYAVDGRPDTPQLPCGGVACAAVIQLAGDGGEYSPHVTTGECAVDRAGRDFRRNGKRLLNNMPLSDPVRGVEVFDGQRDN
jgi:hypothetical protein